MMKLFYACFIVFIATPCLAVQSITQHGITWTFADDETCGTFVNSDNWCITPLSITNISPGYTTSPRAMNGSMIDPSGMPQGYDAYQNYGAEKNVGIGVSVETPLVLTGNVSLVSTISNLTPGQDANGDHLSYVKSAAVLTGLSSAPPAGSFRPGISSTTKTLHNISSIDWNKLTSLYYANKPTISTYTNYLQMVWLCHAGSVSDRYLHPSASGMNNYYFPSTFSTISKMLLIDYSNSEKEPLLINFIQLGIDIYSYIESGAHGWSPDGGQASGRKWPILFAGIMLDYAPMKNIGQRSGDYLYVDGHGPENPPSDYVHFGEDGQTFYVAQSDIDVTNSVGWDPHPGNPTPARYTTAMIGMPEWNERYSVYTERGDASWKATYRSVNSNGPSWEGFAISALIMGAKPLWNHNAFFDYMDRYMAITNGDPDPFGYTVPDEFAGNRPGAVIWDTYRRNYPYPPYPKGNLRTSGNLTPHQQPGNGWMRD